MEWFTELDPVVQALLAGGMTWGLTAAGAGLVLLSHAFPRSVLDAALGFAAGVMVAASFFSLLAPAVEMAEAAGQPGWLPAVLGFLGGAAFLRLADAYLPHLHPFLPRSHAEGPPTTWQRTTLLVLAITLHNIPEGLAVGVAFAAAHLDVLGAGDASLAGAVALAIGIGIQNIPEGMAVSLPLRQSGVSRRRSLWYGQLSAAVEPLAAAIGAAAVIVMQPLLPYALAFAAGAMIYVVVEELIPEAQHEGRTDLVTSSTIVGFALMMFLDIALG
ncbi:MAG TPA: ZIP family metal transporter [Longimicrobiales bacterium]|nr:ZIP family metal transporter [Longimicrobiales bacterium]